MIQLTDAIVSLYPNAQFILTNEDYSTLIWPQGTEKPSKKILETEISRLQTIEDSLQYKKLRANEYPPFADYLDGIVKGDTQQVQDYIDACLAVKAKYPKPE